MMDEFFKRLNLGILKQTNELWERLDNGRTQGSCMIDELWEVGD
jgi:hypothetical protein